MPEPGAAPDAADFWIFSLDFYGREGIAATCLDLQDRHGLDVNLLLLCCWHGWRGRGPLADPVLAAAEDRVGGWNRSVVAPLRAIRRALAAFPAAEAAALRSTVRELELAAEREAQRLLVAGLPETGDGGDRRTAAAAGLAAYLARHGVAAAVARPLLTGLDALTAT